MKLRGLLARMLIGLVTFLNLQCAVIFLLFPDSYSSGFELAGIPGEVQVRGLGILFIMWNIPYIVALADPIRFRVSLYEAIVMQAVGLIGETSLLITLPPGHTALQFTAHRFIGFDGAGLGLLILAAILTIRKKSAVQPT